MEHSRSYESLQLERLRPDNCVFLFIDHHEGITAGITTIDPAVAKQNTIALAKIARIFGVPCLLTGEPPNNVMGPIYQELKDVTGAEVLHRSTIDALDDRAVRDAISATGRKKIVMCGMTTEVCLVFPAQTAIAMGYDVYCVMDCSGTWNSIVDSAARSRLEAIGATLVTWLVVGGELQRDWSLPTGSALMGMYAGYAPVFAMLLQNASHMQGHDASKGSRRIAAQR